MSSKKTERDYLQESLLLARESRWSEAASRLEVAIKRADQAGDFVEVGQLSQLAAVFATRAGDLQQAETFTLAALAKDSQNPYTHFAIAEIYKRMGREAEAFSHMQSCYEIATATSAGDVLELLRKVGFGESDSK